MVWPWSCSDSWSNGSNLFIYIFFEITALAVGMSPRNTCSSPLWDVSTCKLEILAVGSRPVLVVFSCSTPCTHQMSKSIDISRSQASSPKKVLPPAYLYNSTPDNIKRSLNQFKDTFSCFSNKFWSSILSDTLVGPKKKTITSSFFQMSVLTYQIVWQQCKSSVSGWFDREE